MFFPSFTQVQNVNTEATSVHFVFFFRLFHTCDDFQINRAVWPTSVMNPPAVDSDLWEVQAIFFSLFENVDSLPSRACLMQSYITQLRNFWARQRLSLVGGGGRQQVSHWRALHLLCIPSPRTVCLSVSSPQTEGNLRIGSFFQLFPSLPRQCVKGIFFFLPFFFLPTRPSSHSSSSHAGPFVEAAAVALIGSQGGWASFSQLFHSLVTWCDLAAANEGDLEECFLQRKPRSNCQCLRLCQHFDFFHASSPLPLSWVVWFLTEIVLFSLDCVRWFETSSTI